VYAYPVYLYTANILCDGPFLPAVYQLFQKGNILQVQQAPIAQCFCIFSGIAPAPPSCTALGGKTSGKYVAGKRLLQ
jgi:hypothetical protein